MSEEQNTPEAVAAQISESLESRNEGNSLSSSEAVNMSLFMDIGVPISIEVGTTQIKLKELMHLSKGAIIELDKSSADPLDIRANGKLIAHGEAVVVNNKYGIRLTSVSSQSDRANVSKKSE